MKMMVELDTKWKIGIGKLVTIVDNPGMVQTITTNARKMGYESVEITEINEVCGRQWAGETITIQLREATPCHTTKS